MPIPPPVNFQYHNEVLSWDEVDGAVEYEIIYKSISGQHWEVAYQGSNKSCPFDKPYGTYKVKGKSKSTEGGWGDYSPEETVEVGSS